MTRGCACGEAAGAPTAPARVIQRDSISRHPRSQSESQHRAFLALAIAHRRSRDASSQGTLVKPPTRARWTSPHSHVAQLPRSDALVAPILSACMHASASARAELRLQQCSSTLALHVHAPCRTCGTRVTLPLPLESRQPALSTPHASDVLAWRYPVDSLLRQALLEPLNDLVVLALLLQRRSPLVGA